MNTCEALIAALEEALSKELAGYTRQLAAAIGHAAAILAILEATPPPKPPPPDK